MEEFIIYKKRDALNEWIQINKDADRQVLAKLAIFEARFSS